MSNLWIRSQDKDSLQKVDYIRLCSFGEFWALYPNDKNDKSYLGLYMTEERATEVLDEIQNALSPIIIRTPIDNYTDKDLKQMREYGIISNPSETIFDTGCVVYQMPEDVKESE